MRIPSLKASFKKADLEFPQSFHMIRLDSHPNTPEPGTKMFHSRKSKPPPPAIMVTASETPEAEGAPSRRRSRKAIVLIWTIALSLLLAIILGLFFGLSKREDAGQQDEENLPVLSQSPNVTLVWQPTYKTTWQIVLDQSIDIIPFNRKLLDQPSLGGLPTISPMVDAYDIDMFNHQHGWAVESLHSIEKKVICYFSAGSYEPYRPDSPDFLESDKGNIMKGWEDERWIDVRSANVRRIMLARLDMAARMRCDAVDPDNVDGYDPSNDDGLGLSKLDAINYMDWLVREANVRGMAVGLKNAGDLIPNVIHAVQFSVQEQCAVYEECEIFYPFIAQGKPVFHIEYPSDIGDHPTAENKSREINDGGLKVDLCAARGSELFSTVLKTNSLNGWVEYCTESTAVTAQKIASA